MSRLKAIYIPLLFFLSLAPMFSSPGSAWAATITVTANAPDALNGANGSCALREAIGNINNGATTYADCPPVGAYATADKIILPAGTYTNAIAGIAEDLNASGDLDILKTVTITGAGAAATTIHGGAIDRVMQVLRPAAVTISGVLITGGQEVSGGGIFVYVDSSLSISNSTISGNNTTGAGAGIYNLGVTKITNTTISNNISTGPTSGGGGIFSSFINCTPCVSGYLTLTGSTVNGNQAAVGAGIMNAAAATIVNSVITGNTATDAGGGIISYFVYTDITGSTISGNQAQTGGGINADSGPVTITNSVISNNTATDWGGGINGSSGAITITGSTISQNTSIRGAGGVYTTNGSLDISNSTIDQNRVTPGAIWGGGGIYASMSAVSITDSTISGNSVLAIGGGVYNTGGNVTFTNSTLNGNSASASGGGLFNGAGSVAVINSTISGNSSAVSGGGIYNDALANLALTNVTTTANTGGGVADNGGTTILSNTIIANQATGADCAGTFTSSGYNIDSDSSCGLGGAGDQPGASLIGMGGLANNGGPTKTHAIGPISVAIDKGSCVKAKDQRGIARPQGPKCDIGAYEANYYTLTVTVTGLGKVTSGTKIICPTLCSNTYQKDSPVMLTATPNAGKAFLGWGGDAAACGTATTCLVPITASKVVTASFTPPPTPPPGGGAGGGGLENQAPYYPGGGSWLVSPDDGGHGNGNTPFVWRMLTDLDGDVIKYFLYVCPGGDFENCQPLEVITGDGESPAARLGYGMGASGVALLLVGFGFTRGGRRVMLVMLAAMALTSSAALIACGTSGDGSSGVTVKACSAAETDSICRENLGLASGDYQWKVIADDGREGGQTESEIRAFTVK
ncbi:MAG: right-handed parallel beta-helix repeat-containing protein [Nitrospinota bacterium]|nr:right-handed parallel beta-helix repeat-containing protein [Nitrospinota bacterium]